MLLPFQKAALCLPSCYGSEAAQPSESREGKASEMGSSRETKGVEPSLGAGSDASTCSKVPSWEAATT